MSEASTEKRVSVRMVYLGQRESTSKSAKAFDCWHILEAPEFESIINDGLELNTSSEGRGKHYDDLRPRGCAVGSIFTFDFTEDLASVYPKTYRDPSRWVNDEDVTVWTLRHKDAGRKSKDAALIRRLEREGGIDDLIAPLVRVYSQLSFAQQSELLVLVVSKIRGMRKSK